jgi:flagellar biosynthesis protein FlhF
VVLVGPPGSGKTTTLIKLAARYGLAAHRPTHILSTDVYRIAAADQLRALASILGIGCTVAETPAAFAQALEEQRSKDLLLIDTPGLGPHDLADGSELISMVVSRSGMDLPMDVHLVLPATLDPADLRQTMERYRPFQPAKLLFTRLDEASRFAMLINESVRSGLPISFLANGQQIPDDLEPATRPRLTSLVCQTAPAPARRTGATA